jgi:hypothetical protein
MDGMIHLDGWNTTHVMDGILHMLWMECYRCYGWSAIDVMDGWNTIHVIDGWIHK